MTGINHRIDCPTRFGEPDHYIQELHPSKDPGMVIWLTRCLYCRRSTVAKVPTHMPGPFERKP